MFLNELIQVPADFDNVIKSLNSEREKKLYGYDPDHIKEIEGLFAKYGFKQLGHGFATIAFSHPNYPYVFRLTLIDDAANIKFVDFCRSQSNPHFPRIIGKSVVFKNCINISKMERLTRISNMMWRNVVNANNYLCLKYMNKYERNLLEDGFEWYTGNYDENKLQNFLKAFPYWESAIEISISMARQHGELDLHKGNIMMRENIPVIMDPISTNLNWGSKEF